MTTHLQDLRSDPKLIEIAKATQAASTMTADECFAEIIRGASKPFPDVFESVIADLTQSAFRAHLRPIVRALWTGEWGYDQAYQAMYDTLTSGFDAAWTEGALSVGIRKDERTADEQRRLNEITGHHLSYVDSFLSAIEMGSKENDGKLGPHMDRLEMWVNRYNEVMMRARIISAQDKKFVWRLGRTKESCSTCIKLAGKVKRGSTWGSARIWPQHPDLECGGFNCLCTLTPTTGRMTPGRLPKIP